MSDETEVKDPYAGMTTTKSLKGEPQKLAARSRVSSKPLVVGEVAHRHVRLTRDYEEVEVDCPAVVYRVLARTGLLINEHRYGPGRVIVPTCVANTLNEMDREWRKNEVAIHTNKGREKSVGEING